MPAKRHDIRDEDILRLRNEGKSIKKIADALGATWGLVRDRLANQGIGSQWPARVDAQRIANAYAEGATIPQLVAIYRISPNAILRVLAAHGVETRESGHLTPLPDNYDEIKQRRREGWSLRKLEHEYGVGRETLAHRLRQDGLSAPRSGRR